ncbi:MAG TPA: L-glutamate gamma-semialdehyde dehydrogenase [Candidatus Poseidoniales archaeon]|nr:MAG TPA: L-glutamate gamma-semialdehyde dehydrogenase [Candidatus Poseidoniales archaeon]HII24774.1 L-glutamate gamma-semialdehyde dehydrogenase [Candidatus Poseidoniaceae archaeon]|tara:strand:- start:4915 stop:6546 length:1632 start_codon:yes stop_codon:yes gene_type:complete
MVNGIFQPPAPHNEPVKGYVRGSNERTELEAELARQMSEVIEIPCIIDGKEVWTNNVVEQVLPHNHGHTLARVHLAGEEEVHNAIQASLDAHKTWSTMPWEARGAIFLKAANMLAGERRQEINASTMLNQSKTCHQAEIDSACELIDFWRFNVDYARQIYEDLQPPISPEGVWNQSEIRPLEGFVFSVTPFNFTSIAGNLPSCAAIMGNTGVWKPSRNSYVSNYRIMKLMMDAGLPAGVINFIPGRASVVGDICMSHPNLAGIHFTGSTAVFRKLWRDIANNLENLRSYPRIVGETGGKDFIVAHPNCDEEALIVALLRGAFEFQGQKCSAASRAYIPSSVWGRIEATYVEEVGKITMGDVADFTNFIGAVIDKKSFDNITGYIDRAHADEGCSIVTGGNYDGSTGYFVEPTTIVCSDPMYESMQEEIFGPVLSIHIYDDDKFEEILTTCDSTSEYALTGSIFATNREDIEVAKDALRFSAGNFYINDKPTGAVVGQQPFGGARGSGTNDKAGSPLNLLRWVSPRSIKETFSPPKSWGYGFLE